MIVKEKYESPALKVAEIQMEESLMATSSEITLEGNGAPDIEDWIDGQDINGNFELY